MIFANNSFCVFSSCNCSDKGFSELRDPAPMLLSLLFDHGGGFSVKVTTRSLAFIARLYSSAYGWFEASPETNGLHIVTVSCCCIDRKGDSHALHFNDWFLNKAFVQHLVGLPLSPSHFVFLHSKYSIGMRSRSAILQADCANSSLIENGSWFGHSPADVASGPTSG